SLLLRQESLEHKKQQLEQNDAFKAKNELSTIEVSLNELDSKKNDKDKALEAKRDKEKQLNNKLDEALVKKDEQESSIYKKLEEMHGLAEEFYFEEHEFSEVDLKNSMGKPFDFNMLKNDADRYRARIVAGRKAIYEMEGFEHSYDNSIKELEQAKKSREDARRDVEKADNLMVETKEEFVEKVYSWENSNKLLKIPNEQLPKLVRVVNSYGVDSEYDDIKSEARIHYITAESSFNKEILFHDSNKSALIDMRKKKTDEFDEWKTMKDPEPFRDEKVSTYRRMLEAAKIPFIPFYKAVDFNKDVPEEVRGRVEEALSDMGILDALIIPEKYLDKLPHMPDDAGDRYIIPNPQFLTQELSQVLRPVVPQGSDISFENIDNTLKSILLDKCNGSTYIDDNGNYCVGIISGSTTRQYSTKYLGIEARKRYRQEIINNLIAEIDEIEYDIDIVDQVISEFKHKLTILNSEFDVFPAKADLETALKCLMLAVHNLEARELEVSKKQETSDRLYAELKQARDRVREVTVNMLIPLTLKDYEEAENMAAQYKDMLLNLVTIFAALLNTINSITMHEDQRDGVLNDIDSIWEDIRTIKRDIETYIQKKSNLEAILQQSDYESIKQEIDECINGLAEIPAKLEIAIRASQSNEEHYTSSLIAIDRIKKQLQRYKQTVDICSESFLQEYKLGYVLSLEGNLSNNAIAKKVYVELKAEEKANKFREDYTAQLHDRYRENSQYLVEYNLRIDTIFDNVINDEYQEDILISKLYAQRRRSELCAKVQGRDVDFFTMLNFIDQAILENEKLLKESDRQLFEDILANTVGKKIRAKIYLSNMWVNKINGLMESMDTSSGLSFSLSWRNKAAENEEQLGTRELVQLLQTDAVLLTEEDMGKLTTHFRSKILQARKSIEDTGNSQSFHIIMKEILDYRKWFEFQLFFKKTNENRKELTDNAFFKFSGGEKAMAMYVPLFSSVYARYDGARNDCPRVISLDEAFAGVDENNIRDMFRLVNELGLDYVINSQVLWGDYDTVPSLSVYELLRPNNADFVSTIRYIWNGKVRKLIMDEEGDIIEAV
ncbi:MAG: TIGR02680 family protein, partial [Ruminiclostridium sp.]